MVEGLYRGWDEVRAVPRGQQSGLRVIVLFTDGASNSVPGIYPGSTAARGLRTWDYPGQRRRTPTARPTLNPQINGLFDTETGTASGSIPGTAFRLELQPRQDADPDPERRQRLRAAECAVPADDEPPHALPQLRDPDARSRCRPTR